MSTKTIELILVHLRRIPRNRGVMFGTLLFPLVFIGVFGFAFNQGGMMENQPIDLAIIANDAGIPENVIAFGFAGTTIDGTYYQNEYVHILETVKYEDEITNIFEITFYDNSEKDDAIKLIQQGDLDAVLTIPSDFSLAMLASFRSIYQNMSIATNNWDNYPSPTYSVELSVQGDQTLQQFGIASMIIDQITEQYFRLGSVDSNGYSLDVNGKVDSSDLTIFDYILPGLVIFGLMQNIGLVGQSAMQDIEEKMLHRLRITKITNIEYTSSIIISNLIISLVQIPIFFAAAIMFGFPFSISIAYAFLIAIILSLAMTGIGLLIAGVVDTTEAVGTAAAMVSTPMAFLAGAFFETPNPTLIPAGGVFGSNEFGLMDFLPPTSAIECLRLILIGGRGIGDVIFQLILLTLLSVLLLLIGVVVYSKNHLSPE